MSTDAAIIEPPFAADLFGRLLALNNQYAEDMSYQSEGAFRILVGAASHVWAEASGMALLIAFTEDCAYNNPNFAWHRARFSRFIYIDRVVVAEAARGRGLARRLYSELERQTLKENRERLVCEIYAEPPNPVSDAFHRTLGFSPVGERFLAERGKLVRYWVKELG